MSSTPWIIGMRDSYFNELYKIFKEDKNAFFVTADNGAPTLDSFALDFPNQYAQVGIAEEQMMGLAAGLAVEGRKVYTYAIAPFVTLRCIEFVKLDQCAMNVPIVNLGVGSGFSYDIMGPTHHTVEDIAVMRVFPNLTIWSPSDANMAAQLAHIAHKDNSPQYIRFDRAGIPDLYNNSIIDFEKGMKVAREGEDITIISTGRFVHQSLKVAELLDDEYGIDATVIDVFKIKPFNYEELMKNKTGPIITFEEHYLNGGLGSIVLESLNDNECSLTFPILRLGVPDKFTFSMGGREVIWEEYGLDVKTVSKRIASWVK